MLFCKKEFQKLTDTGESLRQKALEELKLTIKDWVSKVIKSDYTIEKVANSNVNYRKDMLEKSFVELDSKCTFREFLNLVRAKSNSEQIGIVFSDENNRYQVKLQIQI